MDFTDKDLTLFVRGLHPNVTESLLYELFLQAGPLSNVSHKGNIAFITYEDADSVLYACTIFNDTPLFGQPIQVRPRQGSCFESFQIQAIAPNPQSIAQAKKEREWQEYSLRQSFVLPPPPGLPPPPPLWNRSADPYAMYASSPYNPPEYHHSMSMTIPSRHDHLNGNNFQRQYSAASNLEVSHQGSSQKYKDSTLPPSPNHSHHHTKHHHESFHSRDHSSSSSHRQHSHSRDYHSSSYNRNQSYSREDSYSSHHYSHKDNSDSRSYSRNNSYNSNSSRHSSSNSGRDHRNQNLHRH